MPTLPAEIGTFLQRVKDDLALGQDRGARATATLPGDNATGSIVITVNDEGAAGNDYSVVVTSPEGTSTLAVVLTEKQIDVQLAVTTDVPTEGANTLALIAAAINAEVDAVTARIAGSAADEIETAITEFSFAGGASAPVGPAAVASGGYLRSQDFATVLELFQDAVGTPLATATGGTATTVTTGSTLLANSFAGSVVTFADDTTTALLQGESAVVLSNTANTLTLGSTLPAAVADGDTYSIRQTLLDPSIAELRESATAARGDSPSGSVYGEMRTVLDSLEKAQSQLAGSSARLMIRGLRQLSRVGLKTGTGSTKSAIVVNDRLRVDQWKESTLLYDGGFYRIVGNTEDTLYVGRELPTALAAGTDLKVVLPGVCSCFPSSTNTHPGGHPANSFLVFLMDIVQGTVESFVVPA